MGGPLTVPWETLRASDVPPSLAATVQAAWSWRVATEYRSAQVLTRFLHETLAAGDPAEVHAFAAEAIAEELRHVDLCVRVARALEAPVTLPDPLVEPLDPAFEAASMPQRALLTALGMLVVNEAFSSALIEDLARRTTQPALAAVISAIRGDEAGHADFGLSYVTGSLGRFGPEAHPYAEEALGRFVAGHLIAAEARIAELPPHLRALESHPEPELARWGLLSPAREALLVRDAWRTRLQPALAAAGLVVASPRP